MNPKFKKLLYESFDRDLNESEREILENELSGSDELRREKDSLMSIRKMVSLRAEQNFEPFFADRVMSRIRGQNAGKEYKELFENISILFRPIAIAATVIIITLVSLNLFRSDRISLENAIVVPDVTLTDAYNPITDLNLE